MRWLHATALVATPVLVAGFVSLVLMDGNSVGKAALGAAGEPARPADSFVDSIGVNTHLYWTNQGYGYASYDKVLKPMLEELGIRHIRDNHGPGINPAYYSRLRDLATVGIRTTLVVDPRDGFTPSRAVSVLREIGPPVEAVDGANEYDLSRDRNWLADLLKYQHELHDAIASDPWARGVATLGPSLSRRDASILVGNLSASCDFGTMHTYNLWPSPGLINVDGELANRAKPFPDRSMMVTEFGYPTASKQPGASQSVSERLQAKYVLRLFLEFFNRGIARAMVYELADQWSDPSDAERNFGLLRNDGSRKPVFLAIENMVHLLHDPGTKFVPSPLAVRIVGKTEQLHQTLLEKRDGTYYLILWNEVLSSDSDVTRRVSIEFGEDIQHASIYDPMESVAAAPDYRNIRGLVLSVPDHPIVIKLIPRHVLGFPHGTVEPMAASFVLDTETGREDTGRRLRR